MRDYRREKEPWKNLQGWQLPPGLCTYVGKQVLTNKEGVNMENSQAAIST